MVKKVLVNEMNTSLGELTTSQSAVTCAQLQQ